MRSLINSLYNPGIKLLTVPMPFGTTTLEIVTLGKMSKYGWEMDQNCEMDVLITGEMPELYITQANGLHVESRMAFDLKCMKNKESADFS